MKEEEKDARTLFVRNVSFDVDESKLEEVFSDVGPVRQCFLVRNKGEQRHRGFGFVQYSIPEDAERAAQQLNGQDLHGRKLKVQGWTLAPAAPAPALAAAPSSKSNSSMDAASTTAAHATCRRVVHICTMSSH
jgi:RNA recognition motif-containing protein